MASDDDMPPLDADDDDMPPLNADDDDMPPLNAEEEEAVPVPVVKTSMGIDLGTTYSCVGVSLGGKRRFGSAISPIFLLCFVCTIRPPPGQPSHANARVTAFLTSNAHDDCGGVCL